MSLNTTQIIIPIKIGDNYISFPATSIDNFETILTNSQIKNSIDKFIKFDPMLQEEKPINYLTDYIEKGRGYYIHSAVDGSIIYDGIEYALTFDQLISQIFTGWNLIGVGSIPIIPLSWCKVIDPETLFPVSIFEPTKAYWINYDDCKKIGPSLESALAITTGILFTYWLLKDFKVIK